MDSTPRRRTGGLASMLPSMLLIAVLGAGAGTGSVNASEEPPLVELTVTAAR